MNSERWGFVVYWQDEQWTINQGPAAGWCKPKVISTHFLWIAATHHIP